MRIFNLSIKLWFLIIFSIIILSITCYISLSIPNTQISDNSTNKVYINIQKERAVVTSSTDISSYLSYWFEHKNDYWYVNYKNNIVIPPTLAGKTSLPLTILKGNPKELPASILLDNKESFFRFKGKAGDIIKIGEKSTVIEIIDDKIYFEISPENDLCLYLGCSSETRVTNGNNYDISFLSNQLIPSIPHSRWHTLEIDYPINHSYTYCDLDFEKENYIIENNTCIIYDLNYTFIENRTLQNGSYISIDKVSAYNGYNITLQPNETITYYLFSAMKYPQSSFKYNETFYYPTTLDPNLIDPFWNTTASNWENGTFNYTEEAVTGELQINDSVEYPNNNGIDLNRNMTGNVLLLHDNETDFSGQGNDGTLVGTAHWNATTYKLGSKSLQLDGNSDYIHADSTLTEASTTTGTWSAWVYRSDATPDSTWPVIIATGDANADSRITFFIEKTTGKLVTYVEETSTLKWYLLTDSQALQDNTWGHVVLTQDGTSPVLYVNGIAVPQTFSDQTDKTYWIADNANLDTFTIGVQEFQNGKTQYYDGNIDEVAIWNRSLSALEVYNLYSAQKGYYESEVFDAGASATWDNVSWVQDSAYNLAELPNNAGADTEDYYLNKFDMTGNILLLHDNQTDYSGVGNDGTLVNQAHANATTYLFGSKSLQFDGTTDSITFSDAPFEFASGAFSLSYWIKTTDTAGGLLYKRTGAGNGYRIRILGNSVEFTIDTGSSFNVDGAKVINDGTWHHVGAVYTGTASYLWIDGVLQGTSSPSGDTDNSDTFTLGTGDSSDFAGNLDEVAIWNRTLSSTEIENIFLRGAGKFNISVQSCDDALCSGETWNATYTTSPQNLTCADNRYFQYRIDLARSNIATLLTPEVWNVSIEYHDINVMPTQGTPILNSSDGTNYTNESLTCYNQSTQDNNGDYVKNIYNWYINDSSIMLLNMPFEGNSTSTSTLDLSGNNYDGAVTNATYSTSSGYDGYGAYTFGSSKWIQSGDVDLPENVTISMWVKPETSQFTTSNMLSKISGSTGWVIQQYSTSTNYFNFAYANGVSFTCNGASDGIQLTGGQWQHFVITKNGTKVNYYLNNILNNTCTGAHSTITPNAVNLYIGRYSATPNNFFNGTIDELQIWNRTLTSAQITMLYNNITNQINQSETSAGERWQCSIYPSDRSSLGTESFSNNLTILAIPIPSTTTTETQIIGGGGSSDIPLSIVMLNETNITAEHITEIPIELKTYIFLGIGILLMALLFKKIFIKRRKPK